MTSRQHKPEDAAWVKSSYSDGTGNNCVEVARLAPGVGIRDSKNRPGPTLLVPATAWATFIDLVRSDAVATDARLNGL
ncbi:DUF397 domain-containing protein [Streptomyces odonnellii]|uniref:DUF397 domain-containing protein n=1 Tax=Streptomyces odonnellii TaxID=1417980 RepID=UPI0006268A29|nr:DUF397 domain-containing protein [Streptomyces odonnellii]